MANAYDDLFATMGVTPAAKKKKKKGFLEMPATGGPTIENIAAAEAAVAAPAAVPYETGVEGYRPVEGTQATLPPAWEAKFEDAIAGPMDQSLKNLAMAHYKVFGTWPDFSLTADLIKAGEVTFDTLEEAIAMFQSVKQSYTGKNDWQLDVGLDTFGEGKMKRAAGYEGFTAETDILDPEMIRSFRPNTVEDFLAGPYMKHTVEGESKLYRPQTALRLDELLIAVPRQWAISQLTDKLTARSRAHNPDRDEDEALMIELNTYLRARVPEEMAPQPTARWQAKTEEALRVLQMERAGALYMATEDEDAAAFLAGNGFRDLLNTLDEQIRLPVDPTGKTDEQKRAWIQQWYVNSRMPSESERTAVHQLYDLNGDAVTIQGASLVGADHMATYTGIISGAVQGVEDGLSWFADKTGIDEIIASDEFKTVAKAVAPMAADLGWVFKQAGSTMLYPVKEFGELYNDYWDKYLDALGWAAREGQSVLSEAAALGMSAGTGAAIGGTIGSIVPGVGTLAGLGVGALIGGVAGALIPNPILQTKEEMMAGGLPVSGPLAEFLGVSVAAMDGEADVVGQFIEDYKLGVKRHEADPNYFAADVLRDWGISPEGRPELSFLVGFGMDTLRDFTIAKGAGAVFRPLSHTDTYRNLSSLGKTKFVQYTVAGETVEWIEKYGIRAESKVANYLRIEPKQAHQIVAEVMGTKADGKTARTAGFKYGAKGTPTKAEALEKVRAAMDETVRNNKGRLDPYAWGMRPHLKERWEMSHGQWYSPDRHPFMHIVTGIVAQKKPMPLDVGRIEEATPAIRWVYRWIMPSEDLPVLIHRQRTLLENKLKKRMGGPFERRLRDELSEIDTMEEYGAWRESLWIRAEELANEKALGDHLLKGGKADDFTPLTGDVLKMKAHELRSYWAGEQDLDITAMLYSHKAEAGWMRRHGADPVLTQVYRERAKKMGFSDKGVPLAAQHGHFVQTQVRKGARDLPQSKAEKMGDLAPEEHFVPEQLKAESPGETSLAWNEQEVQGIRVALEEYSSVIEAQLRDLHLPVSRELLDAQVKAHADNLAAKAEKVKHYEAEVARRREEAERARGTWTMAQADVELRRVEAEEARLAAERARAAAAARDVEAEAERSAQDLKDAEGAVDDAFDGVTDAAGKEIEAEIRTASEARALFDAFEPVVRHLTGPELDKYLHVDLLRRTVNASDVSLKNWVAVVSKRGLFREQRTGELPRDYLADFMRHLDDQLRDTPPRLFSPEQRELAKLREVIAHRVERAGRFDVRLQRAEALKDGIQRAQLIVESDLPDDVARAVDQRFQVRFGPPTAGDIALADSYPELLLPADTWRTILGKLDLESEVVAGGRASRLFTRNQAVREVQDAFAAMYHNPGRYPEFRAKIDELARRLLDGEDLRLVVPEEYDIFGDLGFSYGELLEQAVTNRARALLQAADDADMAAAAAAHEARLTQDALDLLRSVDEGGVPAMWTTNLRRIARENGVEVTDEMTPDEFIEALRRRYEPSPIDEEAELAAERAAGVPEAQPEAPAGEAPLMPPEQWPPFEGRYEPPTRAERLEQQDYPETYHPWSDEMRRIGAEAEELQDELREIPLEEVANEHWERMVDIDERFRAARQEWFETNPRVLDQRLDDLREEIVSLRDVVARETDEVRRLDAQFDLQQATDEYETLAGLRGQVDDAFEEAGVPRGFEESWTPRADDAVDAAFERLTAAQAAEVAAHEAFSEACRQLRAAGRLASTHRQRLENWTARMSGGTVYPEVTDPDVVQKIKDLTETLDPAAPIDARIDHLYTQLETYQQSIWQLQHSTADWFDDSNNFLYFDGKLPHGLEPQPGAEYQLKTWYYPRYNYNKLGKFMQGGVIRLFEQFNARKWFGHVSADDMTTLYKAMVMAKISTLLRIPMADEATRFITEGINPVRAWSKSRQLRALDKMPDDIRAEIASLLERISYGDSKFITFDHPNYLHGLLKYTVDERRDRSYGYWLAGQLDPEGAKAMVREFIADPDNEKTKLYRWVSDVLRGDDPDREFLAYLMIGTQRDKALHNLAFQTHRLTRRGAATKQVVDMSRMIHNKFSAFYNHPALGAFWKIDRKLTAQEIARLRAGKPIKDLKFGVETEFVDTAGKTVKISGDLSGPISAKRNMRSALNAIEDMAKNPALSTEQRQALMPWIVAREEGVVTGGVPVIRQMEQLVYGIVDRIGTTMNEAMYATAFEREVTALKAAVAKTGKKMSEEEIERLAHYHARRYVFDTMFNAATYMGEDMLRNIFLFLPAYRQFITYWLPQMVKKPLTVGSFVVRTNYAVEQAGEQGTWVRAPFLDGLQFNVANMTFLINQGNNSVFGWLPGGAPLITMPVGLMATVNAGDENSIWGELPRHWPFEFATPYRALNSPLDKMFYGITGRRLPWPFGTDPSKDPWRELMEVRAEALKGKWPEGVDTSRGVPFIHNLQALVEGGWNYLVPVQMRYSDPDVQQMVEARRAYNAATTAEGMEKILSEPGNETFKSFVTWQNLPSYEQYDYLKLHPEIIPFMVSGYVTDDKGEKGQIAISWSKMRNFGIADPEAYLDRLGQNYTRLQSILDALETRELRDKELAWWAKYKQKHGEEHGFRRLENEFYRSEGAFAPGGSFYQQGKRGEQAWQDLINLKFAGIDDTFTGIGSYDTDAYRLAAFMDATGGAAKKLLQMSPNYEMYMLRKIESQRDAAKGIAQQFIDTRETTELTPEQVLAAGYSEAEADKISRAVNYVDRIWDEANRRIKPLGKYGYATTKGREIRKQAILLQNAILHSDPTLEKFLGDGPVSMLRTTYLTQPSWLRTDFVDLEKMDKVERETFYRLLGKKDPETEKSRLAGVPFLPEKGARELPAGEVVGYVPVLKGGKVVAWKSKVRIGDLEGLVSGKEPKGVSGFNMSFKTMQEFMKYSFEHTPGHSQKTLVEWRRSVKQEFPKWARTLMYDWVRAEAWKHYLDAAAEARSHMRDEINIWYSDTPGFSLQSKYGMKLKKWLSDYGKYLAMCSPEFAAEYADYNGRNMLTNSVLSWYL